MQRIFHTAVLMVMLAACQNLEDIGAEQGDRLTYRTTTYSFTGGGAGNVNLVYKLYEEGGQAAICAFLSADPTMTGKVLTEKWFAQATLTAVSHDGDATPLGYGSFLKVHEPGATVYDGEARCVRSAVPWTDDFEEAVVIAKGPRSVKAYF